MKSNEFVKETSSETDILDALHKDYSEVEKKQLSKKQVYADQNVLLGQYANDLATPELIKNHSQFRNDVRELKKYCANQETITLIDDLLNQSEEIQKGEVNE